MNPWRWVDRRVREVRLVGVKDYLTARDWAMVPSPNPELLRFEFSSSRENPSVFQMIPASDSVRDFTQSVTYLITTLSEIEDRHPDDVLADMLTAQEAAKAAGRLAVAGRRSTDS